MEYKEFIYGGEKYAMIITGFIGKPTFKIIRKRDDACIHEFKSHNMWRGYACFHDPSYLKNYMNGILSSIKTNTVNYFLTKNDTINLDTLEENTEKITQELDKLNMDNTQEKTIILDGIEYYLIPK